MNPNKALWEKGDFTQIAAFMRESGEEVVKSIGIRPPVRALDLGCGDGTTAMPLALLGAEVTGIDIARNLVEAGNRLISEQPRWMRLVRRLRPGKLASVFGKGGQAPRAALVCFDCETFVRGGTNDPAVAAARALRARLGEISETFGINLPVYVIFTKGDRLPFFADYVRNLTGDEATQVFGTTVPMRAAGLPE